MHTHEKHRGLAEQEVGVLNFGVITVSSSRYWAKMRGEELCDESGENAVRQIEAAGHRVTSRKVVDDDVHMIRFNVLKQLFEEDCNVCVTLGGTGVSPRDFTIEAIRPLLDKELTGFQQLFVEKSLSEIGSAAMMTRSTGGVLGGRLVFSLPGAPEAASTGLKIILSEVKHLYSIANQH
ncbi:MAG: MogA/MoaB family molybdenum cofactor biosynthesis protein [Thermoprotei archaeon]